jgi:hypothetical protein
MNKIPTVFVRDPENPARVVDAITQGCEWVFDDPLAVATRKYDGTCVKLSRAGHWYARREVRGNKPAPPNYTVVEYDQNTNKFVGWEPIEQSGFARWHAEALDLLAERGLVASLRHGTYELCGPKVNGNPEGFEVHQLIKHGSDILIPTSPVVSSRYKLSYSVVKEWVAALPYEGIVWWHPAGYRAKIKKRDFGYTR